ncbi:hypothetical protein B484DRAFT_445620 [Ochromonadaceae sp. CCMP2298]|nr:hypothetical protein B484DRAFT_445620 [Ochromonadaceae sp. CCMP2298]
MECFMGFMGGCTSPSGLPHRHHPHANAAFNPPQLGVRTIMYIMYISIEWVLEKQLYR